ncbi:MAG: 4-phosphopantoate--beta-alanine ligase [Candidatus Methanospirareceae archaeon]
MNEIPKNHPRYASLIKREKLVEGIKAGITSQQGLIAHGRGEAFDYIIGERTMESSLKATKVAAALLLVAKRPILSVNGNVAALVPKEMIELANLTNAVLEVNIFYRTEERVKRIKEHLEKHGAKKVLGVNADARIPYLDSERAKVAKEGIYSADVVLAPLEDGDRCEALIRMGKKVITIDLNPFSRTSNTATISIVDDIERAVKNLISFVKELKDKEKEDLEKIIADYDNKSNLKEAIREIAKRLEEIYASG